MRVTIDIGTPRHSCFVVMPFSPKADLIYREVFKPGIEKAGLSAIRGDEIFGTKRIMQDVWDSIRKSRVVLAELSGRNPNVLYELGLSHAIGKPVVLVTSSMDDVPFDLKDIRCIVYEKDHPRWGESLRRDITESLQYAIAEDGKNILLSDIRVEGTYPAAPVEPIAMSDTLPQVDLTGEWQGKEQWDHLGFERTAQLYLTQLSEKVNGIVLVQRRAHRSATPVTIKQTVSGRVDGTVMNLVATSYEFVSGNPGKWELESWQASIDGNQMKGTVSDGYGNQGRFLFLRVDERSEDFNNA